MKNVIKSVVLVFVFFCSFQLSAQSLDLGIKGGVNYASISNLDSDGRLGFTGGVFVGARFNTLGLQAEVLFSQQGGRFNQNDIETDYVLVPVLAKLHFLRIFNIQFGPQFSYLLNEKDILGSEKVDISGAVGLGLSLGSGLRVDARYNFGFTDAVAFNGASGENRFISLALGYSFL
ncbi:outer membrane channel superfamily protein [Psychroflexus torquis ATCC 700755]|uniref:Outer membrane channel superfamily protein n=1 Tax=Psychroflexus torquis (strain ATCC 700755 / CIP 106069 / ACAM 623) TaxID=313595 RepID=K4II82_PSYTT|nr:porin family protein [Psychroflexus torquis]AFU70272.1 outer membrane channel superfamily protein [Psychroflexus torquis ATCC 700755]